MFRNVVDQGMETGSKGSKIGLKKSTKTFESFEPGVSRREDRSERRVSQGKGRKVSR